MTPSPATDAPRASDTATASGSPTGSGVERFALANGLEIVVVPDRRTPVVTHMIWYRNGAGDDPVGKSGIAHFLEHLMFKGTEANPGDVFTETVTALGGEQNAFTGHDYTAYYQRVAKEHLGTMMRFEADRMTGLVLSDDVVAPERDVVLEERRMHYESDPGAQLYEALMASLHPHHPYGTPVIGWLHEIEGLNREDALDYYGRFYTPENAILVVAGDVDAAEVRALAEDTYGQVRRRNDAAPPRERVRDPEAKALRRVAVADAKVKQPYLQRIAVTPTHAKAEGREVHALEVLAHALGAGSTSRLYRALVLESGLAVNAGCSIHADGLDAGHLYVFAVPQEGMALDRLEAEIDAVISRVRAEGLEAAEIARAKTKLVADMTYAKDSQRHMAHIYGATLATGGRVEDVETWADEIDAVTPEDIRDAAARWLDPRRQVTGQLLPAGQPVHAGQPVPAGQPLPAAA